MTNEVFSSLMRQGKDEFLWVHSKNMDITGGVIPKSELDEQLQGVTTEKVMISGLKQDTFEYFIEKYAVNFRYIKFFKNKFIEDLSPLALLKDVVYMDFFHNQRVTKLWDMSQNTALEGLSLNDFTRLHDIEMIETAPNLKHFDFGDMIWSKNVLLSVQPLSLTKLESFMFSGKDIEDKDISPYWNIPTLRYLGIPSNLYSTEDLAKIVARCPDLKGEALQPYRKFEKGQYMTKDILICGKRKPWLDSEKDIAKIKKYEESFWSLVEAYRNS